MGVQHEPFSVAKQATPTSMHPTPDILPLKSRTIFEQSTGNNKHPFSHSKLLQVVQIPKKERKFHHLIILSSSWKLGTKSRDGCFEVSNAFDPTVRGFLRSPLPRRIQREKEREIERMQERSTNRYIYIYRSMRADIRTSFSIRDRKWLRANWRALCVPPPPPGSSASGPAIRRIACHRPRARSLEAPPREDWPPSVEIKGSLRFEAC